VDASDPAIPASGEAVRPGEALEVRPAPTVVVADRHPITLDGLTHCFRTNGMAVVAQCTDGGEALKALRHHRPDLLTLDFGLNGKDGLTVLREMRRAKLPTRPVLLTSRADEDQILEAIRLGVRGVVLKEMAPTLLVQCLRTVHAGEQWVEKRSVGQVLDQLLRHEMAARQLAVSLTAREIEVLRLVATGVRNRVIAERLFVKEGTVKIHLHNIFRKFGVTSRLALSLYAKEKGFV
jgi:DNA-binding NarL/FixJ family response regulator